MFLFSTQKNQPFPKLFFYLQVRINLKTPACHSTTRFSLFFFFFLLPLVFVVFALVTSLRLSWTRPPLSQHYRHIREPRFCSFIITMRPTGEQEAHLWLAPCCFPLYLCRKASCDGEHRLHNHWKHLAGVILQKGLFGLPCSKVGFCIIMANQAANSLEGKWEGTCSALLPLSSVFKLIWEMPKGGLQCCSWCD